MRKGLRLLVTTWAFFNTVLSAAPFEQTNVNTKNHTHHSAYGTHGMALVQIEDQLVLSHMPLINSMHEHQIIFTAKVAQKNLKNIQKLLKNNQLVSLLPEKFDLNKLQSAQLKQFKAEVFAGHFERNGKVKLTDITFSIEQILLDEKISPNQVKGKYHLINLANNNVLAVHQIGKLPSFDHLVHLTRATAQHIRLISTKGELLTKERLNSIANKPTLIWQRSLYLETDDFSL